MQLVLYTLITATPREGKEKNRKAAASTISVVPKGKKIKVLTHRPRYIETAVVPEFGEGTPSAAEGSTVAPEFGEAEQVAPAVWSVEGSIVAPKVPIVGLAEAKDGVAKEPELEKTVMLPGILSPTAEAELPKVTKAPAITPKRRRMASVLDAVMETTKALTSAPAKKVAEAATAVAEAEAGPSVRTDTKPAATEDKAEQESPNAGMAAERDVTEKAESLIPEAPSKDIDYIIQHASGKKLSEEEILEAKHYARELKYLKGALVFNGTDIDYFLYCLPDNKEISVCKEMAKSMRFPKLEADLSAMSKDDLADSLAYNSMKVQKLVNFKVYGFENEVFHSHADPFFCLIGLNP
jgi:chemotaxis protein histidine kinase CheA